MITRGLRGAFLPASRRFRLGRKPMASASPVAEVLARRTAPAAAELVERLPDGRLRCFSCGHRCPIPEGRKGSARSATTKGARCGSRAATSAALQCDPIEKKPFFHALPGLRRSLLRHARLRFPLRVLSELGHLAVDPRPRRRRAPRDIDRRGARVAWRRSRGAGRRLDLQRAADHRRSGPSKCSAKRRRRGLICSTSPTATARPRCSTTSAPVRLLQGRPEGLSTTSTTASSAACCSQRPRHDPRAQARGIWLEVVTLVVPGFNDSEEELAGMRRVPRVGVDPTSLAHHRVPPRLQDDRPGRDSRFHPVRAAEIGTEEGLRYVYAGNLPGRVGPWEDTRCPTCGTRLIERLGFRVLKNRLRDGVCPDCATPIPGRWDPRVEGTTRTHGIPLPVV